MIRNSAMLFCYDVHHMGFIKVHLVRMRQVHAATEILQMIVQLNIGDLMSSSRYRHFVGSPYDGGNPKLSQHQYSMQLPDILLTFLVLVMKQLCA